MRFVAVVQARLSSSRLPGKLALDIGGRPLLSCVAERLRLVQGLDGLMLATSDQPEDDITEAIGEACGMPVFRGDLQDAQRRFVGAAEKSGADVVIRVTGDNPYTEPSFIEELIEAKRRAPAAPYAVHDLAQVVYGTASELIDVAALKRAAAAGPSAREREHITPSLRAADGAITLAPADALSDRRLSLTVDTLDDYVAAVRLNRSFGAGREALGLIVDAYRRGALPPGATRHREGG